MKQTEALRRLLAGPSAKAVLALVLLLGLTFSLPFWMRSTSEDRQHMRQLTTVPALLEDQLLPLPVMPREEQDALRRMFRPPSTEEVRRKPRRDYAQVVWEADIRQLISPWVSNADEAQEIAYWTYYYCRRFHLSIELVLALMSVESNFDHFAVSNVGARGLMQVMPFWKEKLGSPKDNLFVIETNIRYGCAVLRHYLDRYHSRIKALQAYNGSLGSPRYSSKVLRRMKQFRAIESNKQEKSE